MIESIYHLWGHHATGKWENSFHQSNDFWSFVAYTYSNKGRVRRIKNKIKRRRK